MVAKNEPVVDGWRALARKLVITTCAACRTNGDRPENDVIYVDVRPKQKKKKQNRKHNNYIVITRSGLPNDRVFRFIFFRPKSDLVSHAGVELNMLSLGLELSVS